ncbi:MAG: hypothetical protein MHPSP_001151, partial [Paramarteilia canceri]
KSEDLYFDMDIRWKDEKDNGSERFKLLTKTRDIQQIPVNFKSRILVEKAIAVGSSMFLSSLVFKKNIFMKSVLIGTATAGYLFSEEVFEKYFK